MSGTYKQETENQGPLNQRKRGVCNQTDGNIVQQLQEKRRTGRGQRRTKGKTEGQCRGQKGGNTVRRKGSNR